MKVSLIGKRNIFKKQSSYNESIYLVADLIEKEGKTLICEEVFVKCCRNL